MQDDDSDREIAELKARIERLETVILWNVLPQRHEKGTLFVEDGRLCYLGPSGTKTVIAVG